MDSGEVTECAKGASGTRTPTSPSSGEKQANERAKRILIHIALNKQRGTRSGAASNSNDPYLFLSKSRISASSSSDEGPAGASGAGGAGGRILFIAFTIINTQKAIIRKLMRPVTN